MNTPIGIGTFNADEHKNDLIPPATYKIAFTKGEMKDNGPNSKDPGGKRLSLEADVQDGAQAGRKLWVNLNLVNTNDKTRAIAQRELGDICRAIGKAAVENIEEIIGIPFMADVTIEEGKNGYNDSNKIKKYHPLGAPVVVTDTEQAKGSWGK